MALWLVRPGRQGEFEDSFFNDRKIYLTWTQVDEEDLTGPLGFKGILELFKKNDPDRSAKSLASWAGQVASFTERMAVGDWVAVPRKTKAAIAIGEITGEYHYDSKAELFHRHSRSVHWIATDVPRSAFDQDILHSLNALMTIGCVRCRDAQARVRAMAKRQWGSEPSTSISAVSLSPESPNESASILEIDSQENTYDLEQTARDQIATLIEQRFTGHGLAELVEAILIAQGYTTHRSPPGPDGGVDIVAGTGALGFGSPRLCVQVKSGARTVEHKILNELVGTMQTVKADQGLLVSWSGFKDSVTRQTAAQFFQVRFWDQNDLLNEIFGCYERLDPAIKAELPLKRIWSLAATDLPGNSE